MNRVIVKIIHNHNKSLYPCPYKKNLTTEDTEGKEIQNQKHEVRSSYKIQDTGLKKPGTRFWM